MGFLDNRPIRPKKGWIVRKQGAKTARSGLTTFIFATAAVRPLSAVASPLGANVNPANYNPSQRARLHSKNHIFSLSMLVSMDELRV